MQHDLFSAIHPTWYLALLAAGSLLPILFGVATSYLKFSLALTVLRNGFGGQQIPNGTTIMVLSLLGSVVLMRPVFSAVGDELGNLPALELKKPPTLELVQRIGAAFEPWRIFLARQCGTREFRAIRSGIGVPASVQPRLDEAPLELDGSDSLPKKAPALYEERAAIAEAPWTAILPAFVLTELKEGLMSGFVLLLPFVVIDIVIANILAGLGMYMVSPATIALPLKILLFIVSDGWLAVFHGLVESY